MGWSGGIAHWEYYTFFTRTSKFWAKAGFDLEKFISYKGATRGAKRAEAPPLAKSKIRKRSSIG